MRKLFQVLFIFGLVTGIAFSEALAAKVFLESGGRVVVEAENFSENTPTGTHEWLSVPTGGLFQNSRGDGYIQALPDNGSGSAALQPPSVEYTMRISTVGTYRLYTRWDSNADQSDSFYASIVELKNGSGGPIADWYRYASFPDDANFATRPWHGSAGFERTDAVGGDTAVLWNITEPGDYTIQFDMREDGVAIDAFVFQLSSLPAPTGDGPPESPIAEDLAITTILSAIKVGEFSSQQLEAIGGLGPFTWSISNGTLPNGMNLTTGGLLSGTPTDVGEATFTLKVTDSNNDMAEKPSTLAVVFVLPPPDIRIQKVATLPVPGRTVDQIIVIENKGTLEASNIQILDILDPSFRLLSVSPQGQTDAPELEDSTITLWNSPPLKPGDVEVFLNQVQIDPLTPFGKNVGQPVCRADQLEIIASCIEEVQNSVPSQCFEEDCAALLTGLIGCAIQPISPGCAAILALLKICMNRCDLEGSVAALECLEGPECEIPDIPPTTGPIDPNEKLVLAKKFIQPDQLLVYPIHYENIGQVEALDVFVTDVLDEDLDLSTVELLTSDGGSIDNPTRTVRWELLGRNLQPGETDNVLLAVKPLPNLPSGTEIRNKAEIQFEIFDSLVTNETVNIIDSTMPTCTMNALPDETTTLEFPVSWEANDAIGEVGSISVFVSESGNGFKPFLEGTLETSTLFTGQDGVRYEFLCVAKDTAGNIESQEPSAEAATTVNPPDVVSVPDVVDLDQTIAEDLITTAGLVVGDTTKEFSNVITAGNVIRQSPLSGTEVDTGSSVDLVISKGTEFVAVPAVVGKDQTSAETDIVNAGLAVGDVSRESSTTVAEGLVIRQTPIAQTPAMRGSEVDLVVSSGPPSGSDGDLNADGCIDRSDYAILIADIRDGAPNNSDHDLNEDGVVNRADARTLVGLFTNPRGAPCN